MRNLLGTIRSYFMWRAIDIALRKKAPTMIPTSGDEGRRNDCYVVYFEDQEGHGRFLANEMNDHSLQGKWSVDGRNFVEECSVPYAALPDFKPVIQHYYRGWTFHSRSVPSFLLKHLSSYPFWRVAWDRLLQAFFNRRQLTRHDRLRVLKYVLAESVKNRNYIAHETDLLTQFYTVRWVFRPDKEELMTYYRLLLDALKESGDLKQAQYGLALDPKAINTIAQYEQEERRHGQNAATQNGIRFLTVILTLVGIAQAVAAIHESWWKK
ncbi:hypothetical protein HFO61_30230 [Rhizobium leguminosarum]|uniref:hypothetical protein n=1 Tax=Rhizobium leguminosarum TaxID=384 RepID=UPI001C9798D7|nr:hypothetical protein [Rhizobium leguminosarum]MBY5551025.1 hypothetical protein [Rhizobium leguminosarum]